MFNNLTIQGHLTADPVYKQGQNGVKSSCWGKLGVYQGKDQQGNDLDSMFIEFTCFGTEADTLVQFAHKGDLVVVSGRFSETKSIGNDGREYINKRVVGNARMCYKIPSQQQAAPQQYNQPVQYQQNAQQQFANAQVVQPTVTQPVQQTMMYNQAPQANNMNPWG